MAIVLVELGKNKKMRWPPCLQLLFLFETKLKAATTIPESSSSKHSTKPVQPNNHSGTFSSG